MVVVIATSRLIYNDRCVSLCRYSCDIQSVASFEREFPENLLGKHEFKGTDTANTRLACVETLTLSKWPSDEAE